MADCYLPELITRSLRCFRRKASRCTDSRRVGLTGLVRSAIVGAATAALATSASADPWTPRTASPATQPTAVQQAGFHGGHYAPTPPPYGPQAGMLGPESSSHYPTVTKFLPRPEPRSPEMMRQAQKEALRGFYGGVEYLNLYIDETTQRVFGNYSDLPDFNDPTLAGYIGRFGTDPGTGLPFAADAQPLQGTLTPGVPFNIDPAIAITGTNQIATNPFFDATVIDPVIFTSASLLGPNFNSADFSDMQSIRGTLGYEFAQGVALEATVLGVGEDRSRIGVAAPLTFATLPLVPARTPLTFIPIVVTNLSLDLPGDGRALVTDGDAGDGIPSPDVDLNTADVVNPLLPLYYDGGLAMDYVIDIQNAQANLFVPLQTARSEWSFDLAFGFNYLNVNESLLPALTFVDPITGLSRQVTAVQSRALADPVDFALATFPNLAWDPVNGFPEIGEIRQTTITAGVENQVYTAQFGMRTELELDWLTLGVSPKVGFGVNNASATVSTSQLFRATDPTVTNRADWEEMAVTFDLGVYAKMRVRDWLNATIGYQLMMANGIAHAPNVPRFVSSTDNPGLAVSQNTDELILQGLTLGFEVVFP